MRNPQTTTAGLIWLLPSPPLRRRFTQHNLPVPTRLPVRWVRPLTPGTAQVQLPGAVARAIHLPPPFITVPETLLRPVSSVVLWATARSALRRSVGSIG